MCSGFNTNSSTAHGSPLLYASPAPCRMLTIYSYPNNYRVNKAKIAAEYVNVSIAEPAFTFGCDSLSTLLTNHANTGSYKHNGVITMAGRIIKHPSSWPKIPLERLKRELSLLIYLYGIGLISTCCRFLV